MFRHNEHLRVFLKRVDRNLCFIENVPLWASENNNNLTLMMRFIVRNSFTMEYICSTYFNSLAQLP